MIIDDAVISKIEKRIQRQLKYAKINEYNQGLYNGMVYIMSLMTHTDREYVDNTGCITKIRNPFDIPGERNDRV